MIRRFVATLLALLLLCAPVRGQSLTLLGVGAANSGTPSWLPQPLPDQACSFTRSQCWTTTTGTVPAASAVTVARATPPAAYSQNSSGVLVPFAPNTLRITDIGLLVEEARTNLAPNGTILGNKATVTLNTALGPDNTTSAFSLVEDTSTPVSSDGHEAYANSGGLGITVAANSTYSFSAYLKKNTRTKARVLWATSGIASGAYVDVDLNAGTIGSPTVIGTGTATSASITLAANGFYRVTITGILNSSATSGFGVVMICNAAGTPYYAGDGVSGIFGFGFQLEIGSFPTSYIPTTTVSVARAADVATLISAPAFGSAYTELSIFTPQAPTTYGSFQTGLQADTGSNSQRSTNFRALSTGLADYAITPGGLVASGTTIAANSVYRSALGIAASDQAFSVNGGAVTTSAFALPATPNVVRIGSDAAPSAFADGIFTGEAIWATQRLPNATLQSITINYLLRRDLGAPANDNSPAFLGAAA